jgi:peptide-methionine (S)-S-oxide reductase
VTRPDRLWTRTVLCGPWPASIRTENPLDPYICAVKGTSVKVFAVIVAFSTFVPTIAVRMSGCDGFSEAMEMNKTQPGEQSTEAKAASHVAYFAAGCFWGVEAAFRRLDGVTATAVGYMGGTTPNPTYKQVCTGRTGHAETVRVEYDPHKVAYEQLLEVFWRIHNPTTLNRQGPDVGSQYRSAIFAQDQAQYNAAVESMRSLSHSGKFARPIVTRVKKAGEFYPAEEYHQQYLEKQGKASCNITLQ